MKNLDQDKYTLLLALSAGLSVNGTFSALFSSFIQFSIFPILSLLLTIYCLHQRYQNQSMPAGLPGLAAACFIFGVLLYSAVVRVEYPEIGSNFLPVLLSGIILLWIGPRLRHYRNAQQAE
ncbi:YijD family membrane protein [Enterobacteriaceae bacterium ESL0689]|nr:YijD family membrane protein [Enterobacteriaceae bacterium ESL0689]